VPPNGKNASGFDFDAAVAAARRDFPRETAKVTFLDLSAKDAADKFRAWLLASPQNTKKLAEKLVAANIPKNGFTRLRDTGEILVAVNPRSASHHLRNPAHEGLFAFHHELGHALTSASLPQYFEEEVPLHVSARHEVAADIFAALRGIAGGTLTREDVENLSLSRALAAPGPHATSRAIDMLLAENTDADIKKMTPQAMRDLSLVYAELYAPKQGEIEGLARQLQWVKPDDRPAPETVSGKLGEKLKKVFNGILHMTPKAAKMTLRRVTEAEWIENVADMFRKAEPGTLAAHTSAKILSSVFNTGKACYPEEKTFDVSGEKWNDLRRKFTGGP
jgi:hypothetical protein